MIIQSLWILGKSLFNNVDRKGGTCQLAERSITGYAHDSLIGLPESIVPDTIELIEE